MSAVTRNSQQQQQQAGPIGNDPQQDRAIKELKEKYVLPGQGATSKKVFWISAAVAATSAVIPTALAPWEKSRVEGEINKIKGINAEAMHEECERREAIKIPKIRADCDNEKRCQEMIDTLSKNCAELKEDSWKEKIFIDTSNSERISISTIGHMPNFDFNFNTGIVFFRWLPYPLLRTWLEKGVKANVEITRSNWAYVLSAVETCSFVCAFVFLLLGWCRNSEKAVRVVAAVVLLVIAELFLFMKLQKDDIRLPLATLLRVSSGTMFAFVWAYQKLAWLRAIVGAVCTICVFLLAAKNLSADVVSEESLLLVCENCTVFTVISVILICCCCCPSWRDDEDNNNDDNDEEEDDEDDNDESNANEGLQDPPQPAASGNSNAGDGPQRTQETTMQYGATNGRAEENV